MPSPQLQKIVHMMRSRPSTENLPVEQVRAAFEAFTGAIPLPEDVRLEPVDAGGTLPAGRQGPAAWVSTPDADPTRTIYHLHGGGYSLGSITTHRELVSRIARVSAARALIIEYRLAPENPFPAAVEDALAGYRWLLSNGADPARTVIAGDSAGGGLTVATLVALRDAGDPLPAAAVCISPWVDLEGQSDSVTRNDATDPWFKPEGLRLGGRAYLGGADPHNPLAAPLYADLTGLPPLLIHAGGAEMLLDDSTRLAENARAAGVDVTLEVWDDMIHVWHAFASMLPEGQQAIDHIGEFVRQRTALKAAAFCVSACLT